MISNVILDSRGAEAELLKKVFHDEAANLSDEQWQIDLFKSPEAFLSYLASGPLIDMACVDVCQDEGAALLEAFRQRYGDVWLMVIADAAVSPMTYLKPSIMPGSLLLRPADAGRIRQVVREFIEAFLLRFRQQPPQKSFLVDSREGRVRIPYRQIVYFEAREKKIFVRVGSREYGFYDTMEHLQSVLSQQFVRCHRSFIINREKIEKIVLSKNMILAEGGLIVPVSRSYRAEMRNL